MLNQLKNNVNPSLKYGWVSFGFYPIPVPTRYFSNGSGAKTVLKPVLKKTKRHTLALSRKSADTELNGNGVC